MEMACLRLVGIRRGRDVLHSHNGNAALVDLDTNIAISGCLCGSFTVAQIYAGLALLRCSQHFPGDSQLNSRGY